MTQTRTWQEWVQREVAQLIRETDGYEEALSYVGDIVADADNETGWIINEGMVTFELRRQLGLDQESEAMARRICEERSK